MDRMKPKINNTLIKFTCYVKYMYILDERTAWVLTLKMLHQCNIWCTITIWMNPMFIRVYGLFIRKHFYEKNNSAESVTFYFLLHQPSGNNCLKQDYLNGGISVGKPTLMKKRAKA